MRRSREWHPSGAGKVIAAFLGNPAFVFLSRHSYAMYLGHLLFLPVVSNTWPVLSRETFTLRNEQGNTLKLFAVTTLLSFPLSIFEEACLVVRKKALHVLFPLDERVGGKEKKEG